MHHRIGGHPLLALLLVLLPALAGCDGLFDDGSGEPLLVATSSGTLVSLLGTTDEARVQWTADIPTAQQVSLVDNGTAVFVGAGQQVTALSLEDGSSLWTASMDDDVVHLADPTASSVFAMTFTGVAALSVADGSVQWTLDFLNLGGVSDDAFAQSGGALVLGGDPIRLLDPSNGTESATYTTGDDAVSEVLVSSSGQRIYAGLADGVAALSASNLGETWRLSMPSEVDHVAASASVVFYSVLGGGLGAVNASSGAEIGSTGTSDVFSALAASDSLLVGARSDATLHAYRPADFASAWTVDDVASPARDLALGSDTLFYANGGFVDGINVEDGGSLWSFQPDGIAVRLHSY